MILYLITCIVHWFVWLKLAKMDTAIRRKKQWHTREMTVLRYVQMAFASLIWPICLAVGLVDASSVLHGVLDNIKIKDKDDDDNTL
jgi:hypothetical protein